MKTIRLNNQVNQVNKVYLSTAIEKIEQVKDDPHGNVYTSLLLSSGDDVKVHETLDQIVSLLRNDDSEMELTLFHYQIEHFIV
ncbi:hypothetical protein [Sphingobacterium multivorum]|uniref:Uncharacterized protein n=1 Tax=Sphingobacterium multivorum TaxID=28454 RepID=A0A654D0G8_SPHMU|nr:hypothetical protein [Sphingobacterium multivorum]VXC99121.1 hypothetical protein SPHINGO8BC_51430 [Sphingobacterium multivorum]